MSLPEDIEKAVEEMGMVMIPLSEYQELKEKARRHDIIQNFRKKFPITKISWKENGKEITAIIEEPTSSSPS